MIAIEKRTRNSAIELFRFLLACCIIGHHMSDYYAEAGRYFFGAYIAVDVFLVLTGLLTMISLHNSYRTSPELTDLQRFLTLIKKKFITIYPLYLTSFVLVFVFMERFVYQHSLRQMIKGFLAALGEVLCVTVFGLSGGPATNGALYYNLPGWYLSAMLAGVAVILVLAIVLKEWFLNFAAPLIACVLFGYLHLKIGSLQVWQLLLDMWLCPLWRAIANLCLGAFSYLLYIRVRDIRLTRKGKAVLSGIELVLAGGLLMYVSRQWAEFSVRDFSVPLIAALLFALLLGQKREKETALDKAFCFLGKLSVPLWLNHYLVIRMFLYFKFQGSWFAAFSLIMLASLLLGWLVQCAVDHLEVLFKKIWPYVRGTILTDQ